MDSAVTTKCRGFGTSVRTAVFVCRALSAIIKLVDGEVTGKLFADAGVQLTGIESCLKML